MLSLKYFLIYITIKYCVWHYKRSLEIQKKKKNKLCYNEVENNHKIYLFYKSIINFPFINPKYIFDIYNYKYQIYI